MLQKQQTSVARKSVDQHSMLSILFSCFVKVFIFLLISLSKKGEFAVTHRTSIFCVCISNKYINYYKICPRSSYFQCARYYSKETYSLLLQLVSVKSIMYSAVNRALHMGISGNDKPRALTT